MCFLFLTTDNMGAHFQLRVLDGFTHYWVSLFSRSHTTQLLWREKTGIFMKSLSESLWSIGRDASHFVNIQQSGIVLVLNVSKWSPSIGTDGNGLPR